MMDGQLIKQHRLESLKSLRELVRMPHEANTPEQREGLLEALCYVAGTLFAAKHGLGVEVVASGMIGAAAMDGMQRWFDERN